MFKNKIIYKEEQKDKAIFSLLKFKNNTPEWDAKIEVSKKPKNLKGTSTHTKHIIITDEQGFELDIALFSDNVETLKIKGI